MEKNQLLKADIEKIAEYYKAKAVKLAKFVARISSMDKEAALEELADLKKVPGITQSMLKASEHCVEELFGKVPKSGKVKKKPVKKAVRKPGSKPKKDSTPSARAKYKYPEGIEDKKKFRQQARAKAKQLQKDIDNAENDASKKKALAALKKFESETYG